MRATLIFAWPEFTRPANSSIRFGLLPAALITVGCAISVGICREGFEWRRCAGDARTSLNDHASALQDSAGDWVCCFDLGGFTSRNISIAPTRVGASPANPTLPSNDCGLTNVPISMSHSGKSL